MENKRGLWIWFGVVVLAVAWIISGSPNLLSGQGTSDSGYSGGTNRAQNCTTGTSTLVQATTSGRTAFSFSASGTPITLCRSGICYWGSSTIVAANTTFTQDDGYFGPYTCVAGNGVTNASSGLYFAP